MADITLYGADWCADCKRSRSLLEARGVGYDYINIDTVPGAADEVARRNDGSKTIPTIIFPDGSVLAEPSNRVLEAHLSDLGLLAS